MFFMKSVNKRGQQMTLGTIILIVLGLVVLVFLIYGFSTGWSNLWGRVTGLGGGNVNVDTVRTACVLACRRGQSGVYAYCNEKKSVVLEGEYKGSWTCKNLETQQVFCKGKDCKNEVILIDKCPEISCS